MLNSTWNPTCPQLSSLKSNSVYSVFGTGKRVWWEASGPRFYSLYLWEDAVSPVSLWHSGCPQPSGIQDPASVSQGAESTGLDTVPGGGLGVLFSESCVVQRCLPAWGEFCDLKRPTTPFPWNPPDRRSRVPLLEFFQHTTGRRLCR